MSVSEIEAILQAEYEGALGTGISGSDLSEQRTRALDYYNGDMSADMPSLEGRSSVVSMDVQEAVEGLMPPLMEIFTAGDQVVKFVPVGPEDVEAAEQETDYVNHTFMQKNPGFLILYSFIKDALLSKNGIVKITWDETETRMKETYENLSDDEFAMIASDPDVEIVAHSEAPDPDWVPPAPPTAGQPVA
jgi:hypothetical protein